MGCVWELDGLKSGAVRHGSCEEGEGWVRKATEVIQERIGTYPPGSVSSTHIITMEGICLMILT